MFFIALLLVSAVIPDKAMASRQPMSFGKTEANSDAVSRVWSVCSNGSCDCGRNEYDIALCSEDDEYLWIQACYCMYYDSQNETILGSCMSTCHYVHFHEVGRVYFKLERYATENGSEFNEAICSRNFAHVDMNREGRFCGRCKAGYGLAAYSYRYVRCIPCTDYGYKNWLLYFTIALLPLTIFYFLVVFLKFNVNSSRFMGVMITLQCIFSSVQLRVFEDWLAANPEAALFNISFKVFTSIFGFINLDFFRTIYPGFCLHPKLNILHIVSLDYIVGLYPFFLIFLTYILITMYDKNYLLVVWAWKPFKWCLTRYRRQLNVKTSLIEIFASFILLSNVKILGVCFDLLCPTRVWDPTGAELSIRYIYYDANIEYFSVEHLPFALLAMVMGFAFVLLPALLLLLYPCHCFQWCLNCCGAHCQTLHIFMDAFQGTYKTEPLDLRQFSAFYLFLRFFLLLSITSFASLFYVAFNALLVILSAVLIAICQPYRDSLHNKLDTVSLLMLSLFYVSHMAIILAMYLDTHWLRFSLFFFGGSVFFLATHVLIVAFYHCKMPAFVHKIIRRSSREQDGDIAISESLDRGNLSSPPAADTPLLFPNERTPLYND
jgi:hypothetical protein